MKNLLAVTAVFEVATGVVLSLSPPLLASLLLGASLATPGGLGLSGIGLWPAVVLHAAMGVWCMACLRNKWVKPSGAK